MLSLSVAARRFLVPRSLVSAYYYRKYGAVVSPHAEVEITRNLVLGRKSQVSSFTKIKASSGVLRVGDRVDIATGCFISASSQGIEIGDDALIGPNVCIVGSHYAYDRIDLPLRAQGSVAGKPIRIGRNVLIGAGACVLEGADIGDGAIIAPHSVVTGPIPPNAIAKGDPAKVVFVRR